QPEPECFAVGEAVQQIQHGVAPIALGRVAWRQVHSDLALGGVALEISLERSAVNRDVLELTCELGGYRNGREPGLRESAGCGDCCGGCEQERVKSLRHRGACVSR